MFLNFRESRRLPVRLDVHIQRLIHRSRTLRGESSCLCRILTDPNHLLRAEQLRCVDPTLIPRRGPYLYESPSDVDDIDGISMVERDRAGILARQIAAQVQRLRRNVSLSDGVRVRRAAAG
jgi:hypothetical protein